MKIHQPNRLKVNKVVDNKIRALICIISLVYFTGIALYSLLPELIDINKTVKIVFYWCNNTLFIVGVTYLFSYLLIDKKAKYLVRGVSLLLFAIGVLQILKSLGYSFHFAVWCIFIIAYILITLLVYTYDRSRNEAK